MMSDERTPPTKRARYKETDNNHLADDAAAKRKQVDAHVQAFLKTVLDHASNNLLKTSSARTSKRLCDAATQTDQVVEHRSDCSWDDKVSVGVCDFTEGNSLYGSSEPVDKAFVPNRAMYSQETLQLASQQDVYYNQLQSELAVSTDVPQCYYTGNVSTGLTDLGSTNSSVADSNGVCRVISEWMEKYERWFYQNFGVGMKSAALTSQSTTLPPATQIPDTVNIVYPYQAVPSTTSLVAVNQTNSVVSAAPVSYLVPEGSVYMPENHVFSPYVSLLPSFYTPAAFSHSLPAQQNLTVSPVHLKNPVHSLFPSCSTASIEATERLYVQSQPTLSAQPCNSINSTNPVSSSVVRSAVSPAIPDSNQASAGHVALFSSLPTELQTSAMLAALSIPVHSNRQPSMGQWGPLLRYGTYGRLPSLNEIQQLDLSGKTGNILGTTSEMGKNIDPTQPTNIVGASGSGKMPPPPPTFILLRRQAMICALQLSCRERGRELFLREKEGTSGLKVDFVDELKQVVEKSINVKPVFLFAKLNNLPKPERSYFLKTTQDLNKHSHNGQHPYQEHLDPAQMYACDLLIGDVLIAEACSTYKQQAQNCAARQAFKLLSQPCFLVGSVRRWELVDYLVLCLSSKADLVPKLPPFLSDPFESLSKKDRKINRKISSEAFDVVNPKPPEDFWLYLADLPASALDEEAHWQRILCQSAEFSQMTVAFDVEVDTETGLFQCSALIDNHRYQPITGSNVWESQKLAVEGLITMLKQTQPVVGAVQSKSGSRWNPERLEPLWGVSERSLINTLMWGKEERDLAIDIEQLEAHCDVPDLPEPLQPDGTDPNSDQTTVDIQVEEDRYASPRHLENFVQAYAASALVTPLRLSSRTVPPRLWPLVRQIARTWGLLSCIDKHCLADKTNLCVLVCKRAPLPRLKRTLYEHESYGCFTLLARGNLQPDAKKRLLSVEPLVYDQVTDSTVADRLDVPIVNCNSTYSSLPVDDSDPYSEEPVTRLARHFIATGPKPISVKDEPKTYEEKQALDDCVLMSAELNQPSNAIEILDDLPKTLIPGIDF